MTARTDTGETLAKGLLDRRLGPRVRLVRNLLIQRVLVEYAPFGLKSGAFSVMALIDANPGCSQVALARESGMDKSAVVAIIDELEAKGLARRARSAEDRRRNILALTEEGRRVMAGIDAAGDRVEAPIRAEFDEAELNQLFALLERAHAALAADEDRRARTADPARG